MGLLPHANGIPTANLVLGLLGLTSTAGLIILGLRGGGVLDFLVSRAHVPGREDHRQPGG